MLIIKRVKVFLSFYWSTSIYQSIYLSLHRVPKDVGSMNKIRTSIPILSSPISLKEGAASNDIIFPSLPCSVGASPDSDSDSMGESESESGLESGLGLYPCGLGLGLGLHLCGLGLKRCGLGLWSYGLGLGLGLHPGGLGLTVSPGESGEKCTRQI